MKRDVIREGEKWYQTPNPREPTAGCWRGWGGRWGNWGMGKKEGS